MLRLISEHLVNRVILVAEQRPLALFDILGYTPTVDLALRGFGKGKALELQRRNMVLGLEFRPNLVNGQLVSLRYCLGASCGSHLNLLLLKVVANKWNPSPMGSPPGRGAGVSYVVTVTVSVPVIGDVAPLGK
jgi:hypothetical protein